MKLCRVINVMFWIFASLEEDSQVLSKKVCAGQYELDIVENSMISYRNAKSACETAGSKLLKLDETISKKITENLACDKRYYVGLRWESRGWTWADGSIVSQNSLNWYPGEPNKLTERCVRMTCKAQLIDVFCNRDNYYICQKDSSISIDSEDKLAVKEKKTYNLSCRASSCKTPTVSWFVNGAEVPAVPNGNNMYQIKSAGSSILRLQNVDISLPSRYNCRANTEALPIKNHYTAIDVEGTPTVSEIFAGRCRSNITILWKPHQLAVNFPHRITAKSNLDGETKSITVTPERRENQNTTINGLSPSLLYSVKISACKHISTCSTTKYTTKPYTVITGERPGPVTKTKAVEANNTCNVSWTPPRIARDEIIRYVVNISKNVLQFRKNIADTEFLIINETREWHFFTLRPNRVYSVQVQATTCAGVGAITKAIGSCIGSSQVPSTLKTPWIVRIGNKTSAIVEIPDESDGLISCLLLVVKNSSAHSLKYTTIEDLIPASAPSIENGHYIAFASSIPKISRSLIVRLGDGSNTSCNALDDGVAGDRKSPEKIMLHGLSRPLDTAAELRVFLVSTSPSKGRVLLQQSASSTLNFARGPLEGDEPTKAQVFIFDPPTFAITLGIALILAVAGLLVVRKHYERKLKQIGHQGNGQNCQTYEEIVLESGRVPASTGNGKEAEKTPDLENAADPYHSYADIDDGTYAN